MCLNGTDKLSFPSIQNCLMLMFATSSQTSHSYFPLFDVDHLEIANCSNLTIVFYPLGNFGQVLCIRSCHEDLILTRKNHNCAEIAFIQGDSAGSSKLIEQTLHTLREDQPLRLLLNLLFYHFNRSEPNYKSQRIKLLDVIAPCNQLNVNALN